MKKRDVISMSIGFLLIFILQIFSFIYVILMDSGYIDGVVSNMIFLKLDLLIVPAIFIIVPLINYYKAKNK